MSYIKWEDKQVTKRTITCSHPAVYAIFCYGSFDPVSGEAKLNCKIKFKDGTDKSFEVKGNEEISAEAEKYLQNIDPTKEYPSSPSFKSSFEYWT